MKRFLINNTEQALKKASTLLVYVLVGYLPFVGVIPSIGLLKEIICILICVLAIANRKHLVNWGTLCVLAYTVLVILGVLFNDDLKIYTKLNVFRYRCMYAVTFCALFNGFNFTKTELTEFGERVLQIIYLSSLFVALIGAVELFFPKAIYTMYGDNLTPHLTVYFTQTTDRRLVSTMSNPINLGLQMSLPIVAGLYFLHNKYKAMTVIRRIFCALSIVLYAVIALYTYSRTAYIAIIGTIIAFYLFQILFGRGHRKKKVTLLFAVCAAALVVVIFLLLNKNIAARFGKISVIDLLNNPRFERAYNAFSNADRSIGPLIFGYGAGKLLGGSGQYVFEFGYASLLFEAGVLGLALFGFAVFKSIRTSIKLLCMECTTSLLALTYLGFIVVFCVAMLTEDVYFQLPICLYFWLSVFMICSIESIEQVGDAKSDNDQ